MQLGDFVAWAKVNGLEAGKAVEIVAAKRHGDMVAEVMAAVRQEAWLKDGVDDIAVGYAIRNIIPRHLGEVRDRKKALLDKMESTVKERLSSEIRYRDFRANELREAAGKESGGKRNAGLNAD